MKQKTTSVLTPLKGLQGDNDLAVVTLEKIYNKIHPLYLKYSTSPFSSEKDDQALTYEIEFLCQLVEHQNRELQEFSKNPRKRYGSDGSFSARGAMSKSPSLSNIREKIENEMAMSARSMKRFEFGRDAVS